MSITGQIGIASPCERVFDVVADSCNEPSFNPAMASVEMLTPPPIGQETRFRARMGRAGMVMLVKITDFVRPHRLASRTTSSPGWPRLRTAAIGWRAWRTPVHAR